MIPTIPCSIKILIFLIWRDPDKNVFQSRKQRFICYFDARSLSNQADIPVIFKNMPVLPKILPSKALDAVTRNRFFSDFSRNRQPKATTIKIVSAEINEKTPILDPFPTSA